MSKLCGYAGLLLLEGAGLGASIFGHTSMGEIDTTLLLGLVGVIMGASHCAGCLFESLTRGIDQ